MPTDNHYPDMETVADVFDMFDATADQDNDVAVEIVVERANLTRAQVERLRHDWAEYTLFGLN